MNREEVFTKVSDSIRTVLNKQPDDIKGPAKIMGDLGAESIDFLDISFELENSLGFDVDFKEIISTLRISDGNESRNDLTMDEVVNFICAKKS